MKKLLMIAVPGIALLVMAFTAPGDVTASADGQYWIVNSSEGISASDMRDLRDAISNIYGVDASVERTYQMMDGSAIGHHDNCQLDQGAGAKLSLNIKVTRTSAAQSSNYMSADEATIRRILTTYSN